MRLLHSSQEKERKKALAIVKLCNQLAHGKRINNKEKFRKENGFWALKASQHRFYAVKRTLTGENFWILVDYDRKKQDQFRRSVRDRVEKRIGRLDQMNTAELLAELLEAPQDGYGSPSGGKK